MISPSSSSITLQEAGRKSGLQSGPSCAISGSAASRASGKGAAMDKLPGLESAGGGGGTAGASAARKPPRPSAPPSIPSSRQPSVETLDRYSHQDTATASVRAMAEGGGGCTDHYIHVVVAGGHSSSMSDLVSLLCTNVWGVIDRPV